MLPPDPSVETTLRREAGLFQVVAYGVGDIVGAGIYVLVGDAAGLAGGLLWLAFLAGAVIALFTGLSYAELASMYPRAASEYGKSVREQTAIIPDTMDHADH